MPDSTYFRQCEICKNWATHLGTFKVNGKWCCGGCYMAVADRFYKE